MFHILSYYLLCVFEVINFNFLSIDFKLFEISSIGLLSSNFALSILFKNCVFSLTSSYLLLYLMLIIILSLKNSYLFNWQPKNEISSPNIYPTCIFL